MLSRVATKFGLAPAPSSRQRRRPDADEELGGCTPEDIALDSDGEGYTWDATGDSLSECTDDGDAGDAEGAGAAGSAGEAETKAESPPSAPSAPSMPSMQSVAPSRAPSLDRAIDALVDDGEDVWRDMHAMVGGLERESPPTVESVLRTVGAKMRVGVDTACFGVRTALQSVAFDPAACDAPEKCIRPFPEPPADAVLCAIVTHVHTARTVFPLCVRVATGDGRGVSFAVEPATEVAGGGGAAAADPGRCATRESVEFNRWGWHGEGSADVDVAVSDADDATHGSGSDDGLEYDTDDLMSDCGDSTGDGDAADAGAAPAAAAAQPHDRVGYACCKYTLLDASVAACMFSARVRASRREPVRPGAVLGMMRLGPRAVVFPRLASTVVMPREARAMQVGSWVSVPARTFAKACANSVRHADLGALTVSVGTLEGWSWKDACEQFRRDVGASPGHIAVVVRVTALYASASEDRVLRAREAVAALSAAGDGEAAAVETRPGSARAAAAPVTAAENGSAVHDLLALDRFDT